MSLIYYMDVHVPFAISEGLTLRGVDVLTSQADATTRMADPELLERAGFLGRILVTQDEDFLVESARRQKTGIEFGGIIFVPQQRLKIGRIVRDLEVIAKLMDRESMRNRLIHLPLPEAWENQIRRV